MAGLAKVARRPFRNKEIVMFNRFAVALLAATLISGPVLAQQPAPGAPATAPAATDKTKPAAAAKPGSKHAKANKGHEKSAKAKAGASTTGAAPPK